MDVIVKIITNQKTYSLTAHSGQRLLDVLVDNGFDCHTYCGGMGVCKKCTAHLGSGALVQNGKTVSSGDFLICQAELAGDIEFVADICKRSDQQSCLIEHESGHQKSGTDKMGIAFDLGTTTLSATLVNITQKVKIASWSELNAQSVYGADVITRIVSARENLEIMTLAIRHQLNSIIDTFKVELDIQQIDQVVVGGNATMLHIFAGVSPEKIGVYPFECEFVDIKEFAGKDIDIDADMVVLLPSVSAYVGADIVSGIAHLDLDKQQNSVLVDLGTNGELVAIKDGVLRVTSTATGPAFEGANIECGLGGVDGAISNVEYNLDKLSVEIISSKSTNGTVSVCFGSDTDRQFDTAKGICGSGLVDLIAILLKENIIDEYGLFDQSSDSKLVCNLVGDKFYLDKSNTKIYLTAQDIREFQLAKSAIRSGVDFLMKVSDIAVCDLEKLYLAGGFGSYINIQSAVAVGLLAKELSGKIECVGNSCLDGAVDALCSASIVDTMSEIASKAQSTELANNAEFNNLFMENMLFFAD